MLDLSWFDHHKHSRNAVSVMAIEAIQRLLEEKHLYQSVELDLEGLAARISKIEDKAMQGLCRRDVAAYLELPWRLGTHALGPKTAGIECVVVMLPNVELACDRCDNVKVHNPGHLTQKEVLTEVWEGSPTQQLFQVTYQCQRCRGEPVTLLIRRRGVKLQLVGRSIMEPMPPARVIPDSQRKRFGEAIIAHHAGYTLAGLLYLRTVIEQHMRTVTGMTEARVDGEKLAEDYAKYLPLDFPKSVPNLKMIYRELSVPIHKGEDDADQFEKSRTDIETHFKQVAITPLLAQPK